ncbi:hypothetical protein BJV77DRAFT_1034350 [Russula vinacea]|nr:hypothetical protein BJV77DRAFT_1034350 [Russula vinacea]
MFRPFPRALQALAPLATSPPAFPTPKAAPSKLVARRKCTATQSPILSRKISSFRLLRALHAPRT